VAEELQQLGASEPLRRDLAALRGGHGVLPPDLARAAENAVEFLAQYNEFVDHALKPFQAIRDADQRL
jgi:hypothetical protein